MRPTALGVKAVLFYVVLVAAFAATPYSNLFFLLLSFLTSLGAVNFWWTRSNMAGLTGTLEEIEPAPAGTGAPLRADLDGGRRPRYALTLELDLEGHGVVTMPAGFVHGATRIDARLPVLPRGVYPVRSARLGSAYPLGLLRVRRSLDAPQELIVFPAPADLPDARGGAGALGEMLGQHGAEGMLQPAGLREYQPGEDLRRVHWKASARRPAPVVQEWEGGTGDGAEVVLDRRTHPDNLEEALALISALTLAARDEKETVTLHTQGLSATFGTGHRPWRDLLAFLAGAQCVPVGGSAPPPASPSVPRLGGGA